MLNAERSFQVGDSVVYPNHGVGVIEQINSRTVGQTVEKFYLLNIKSSSLKVSVPFRNANAVGLRRVARTGDVQKVLAFLEGAACDSHPDWKERFRENSERMRTGSLLEVAAVLKCLLALDRAKPLSSRERKMLERARYLLVSELALAKNCAEGMVEELLTKALARCRLRLPEVSELAS